MSNEDSRFQVLDWDSDFFGFKVARIDDSHLDQPQLAQILKELAANRVHLVYWAACAPITDNGLGEFTALLVDRRATFVTSSLNSAIALRDREVPALPWHPLLSKDSLEDLAIQSGELSRFAVDPHIPRERFELLYRNWMRQSLNKILAREVLVIEEDSRIHGMVTVNEKHCRGNIGLIAVDRSLRNRGIGSRLMASAHRWFLEQGFASAQVVTQGHNTAACALYCRCGYTLERQEFFYHFWRTPSTAPEANSTELIAQNCELLGSLRPTC